MLIFQVFRGGSQEAGRIRSHGWGKSSAMITSVEVVGQGQLSLWLLPGEGVGVAGRPDLESAFTDFVRTTPVTSQTSASGQKMDPLGHQLVFGRSSERISIPESKSLMIV